MSSAGGKPRATTSRYNRCVPLSLSLPSPWKTPKRAKPGREDADADIAVSADVIYIDTEEQRSLLARGESVHENGVTMRKAGSRTPRERVFADEADRDLSYGEELFKNSRFATPAEARASISQANGHASAHGNGAAHALHGAGKTNGSLRKPDASLAQSLPDEPAPRAHRASPPDQAATRKPVEGGTGGVYVCVCVCVCVFVCVFSRVPSSSRILCFLAERRARH